MGAEGLSGLAKAFFYAGARSLLVSHWSIETEVAARLTTAMRSALAANPDSRPAEALRRAMIRLMEDDQKPYMAHPAFWAPFVVVGGGGVYRGYMQIKKTCPMCLEVNIFETEDLAKEADATKAMLMSLGDKLGKQAAESSGVLFVGKPCQFCGGPLGPISSNQ